MRSYDNISYNDSLLLDLPLSEGAGDLVRDQAKARHQDVLLINTPVWDTIDGEFGFGFTNGFDLGSGMGVLTLDGVNQYGELDNLDSLDLNFMADDYSLGCWIYWQDNATSDIIMARYQLNVSGWELYLYSGGGAVDYLTQRHHHAGTLVGGNPRSGCYSVGWTSETWHFMGTSRMGGGEALHYRNGVAVTMATGGLVDPETNNNDLVIGCRYSKDADWYKGKMWRPRIWNRALSAAEWLQIFEEERRFFGV